MVLRASTYLLGMCETDKVASLLSKKNKCCSLLDISKLLFTSFDRLYFVSSE